MKIKKKTIIWFSLFLVLKNGNKKMKKNTNSLESIITTKEEKNGKKMKNMFEILYFGLVNILRKHNYGNRNKI